MNILEAAKELNIKPTLLIRAVNKRVIGFSYENGKTVFTDQDIFNFRNRKNKKAKLYTPSKIRPNEKKITDSDGSEITLMQCQECKEYKPVLYQYYTCSTCLHPVLKKLVVITNQVRGLVK